MDKYAVIGNPIAHSKSPLIHTMFAKQNKQSMEYSALLSKEEMFEKDIKHFFANGGFGLNVTVPFKLQAFTFADQLSERAQLAGAVNTLIKKGDNIIGDNTDGLGLVKDIIDNNSFSLQGKNILLIGAGGASRGVIAPLFEQKPKAITVANRTASKAQVLAENFASYGKIKALSFEALENTEPFDLIINASSAGLSGEVPALPESISLKNTFCYDMVYAKNMTPFLAWAINKGCKKTADGLGMLAEQAAESFYLWRNVRPETKSVLKKLREELK